MEPNCYGASIALYNAVVARQAAAFDAMKSTRPWTETAARRAPSPAPSPSSPRRRRRSHDWSAYLPGIQQAMAYVALLVPAYGQPLSCVGGDLSNQAPYGLPAKDFAAAVAAPSSNASFKVTGYDTSLPASAVKATADPIDGWLLDIGVTGNVPLTNANFAVDKDQCIAATTLAITPPAKVASCNSTAWRVCAVVFTDGLANGVSTRTDGSCSTTLPDNCIIQLQENSVSGSAGHGGGCHDLDIPASCAGYFGGQGRGTGFGESPPYTTRNPERQVTDYDETEITPIGKAGLPNRRSPFFAAGFAPGKKGNKTAYTEAERRAWPVLLTWTHFDETGAVEGSAGWLSCSKATTSKETADTSQGTAMFLLEGVVNLMFLVWLIIMNVLYGYC